MPVVGGADNHRIDVVAGEYLVVVACGEEVGAVPFAGGVESAVEDVASGHQLDPGDAERGGDVGHPHTARADDGKADAVGGRDLLPGERLAGQLPADGATLGRNQRGHRGKRRTGREGLDELAPATGGGPFGTGTFSLGS